MSLVECRECGHQVSTEAESCPECGARHPTSEVEARVERAGGGARRFGAGLILLLATVVFVWMLSEAC